MRLSARNILAVLLLAIVLVYGGLKGYIHYKYKKAFEQVSSEVRMFATLRHDSISSSLLDSSLTIHGVSVLPSGFDDAINIDEVVMKTPGLSYLLSGIGSGRGNNFPEQLELRLNGLKIDLYSSLVEKLERILNQLNSMSIGQVKTACANKLYLGPSDYREMGYDVLDSSLLVAYTFADNKINMIVGWTTQEMASATIELTLSGPSRPSAASLAASPPRLENLTFTYDDLSYTQRSNAYCQKKGNYKTLDDYISAEVNQGDRSYAMQWGFIPGPGIKQAFKSFLTKPESFTLKIRPPADFNPQNIHLYKTEDLPNVLNMELLVNNKPVSDLRFRLPDSDGLFQGEASALQLENLKSLIYDDKPLPEAKPEPRPAGPAPAFHPVEFSQLNQFIGKKIRVYTLKNQLREGFISRVTSKTVFVSQQVHQGEFTMNIDANNIKSIEVFYAR